MLVGGPLPVEGTSIQSGAMFTTVKESSELDRASDVTFACSAKLAWVLGTAVVVSLTFYRSMPPRVSDLSRPRDRKKEYGTTYVPRLTWPVRGRSGSGA